MILGVCAILARREDFLVIPTTSQSRLLGLLRSRMAGDL